MGWPGPVTKRQLDAWTAWWEWEWNRPSRSDHYAMQTALASGKSFKEGTGLGDLRLKFLERGEKARETPQQDPMEMKRLFLGMFRIKPTDGVLPGDDGKEVGP